MLKGNINYDKELLKIQKRGLYNSKTKVLACVIVCVLITLVTASFALFEYNSETRIAYKSKINKYLAVDIIAKNATVSQVGTVSSEKASSKVLYNTTKLYYFYPQDGYMYDKIECTNNQTATYDSKKNILRMTPHVQLIL